MPETTTRTWSTPGTYSWTVPYGVESIRGIAIGAGASSFNDGNMNCGGGGACAHGNVAVVPLETLTIILPALGRTGMQDTLGPAIIRRGSTDLIRAASASSRAGGTVEASIGTTRYAGGRGSIDASQTYPVYGGGAAGTTGAGSTYSRGEGESFTDSETGAVVSNGNGGVKSGPQAGQAFGGGGAQNAQVANNGASGLIVIQHVKIDPARCQPLFYL